MKDFTTLRSLLEKAGWRSSEGLVWYKDRETYLLKLEVDFQRGLMTYAGYKWGEGRKRLKSDTATLLCKAERDRLIKVLPDVEVVKVARDYQSSLF